ncbi:UNVERIFIED_CONTAM: Serine/threonine-protein kinase ATG1t [Sesamum radiatum]|uniref:Serine/threonine-protein kinase ATG1t n=1 Tax=Sesamum radiatum TaxID=300843 RepID=A0AAW2P4I0_SESRA
MGKNFANCNFQEQSLGDYVLRSKLGEGSLSTVWRAEHRTTGEVVALKQIPLAKLTRHLRNCLECAGLKVLKQNHIVHRDLKPENILLSCSDCNPILKIADFGLSRILLPHESAEMVCGSPLYMAPEILQFQRYDEKVDMWSVGAILFELLNGYPPFHGRYVQFIRLVSG